MSALGQTAAIRQRMLNYLQRLILIWPFNASPYDSLLQLHVPRKKIEYGLVKVSTGPTRSGGPWFWADRSGAENMERSCMYPAKKLNMG